MPLPFARLLSIFTLFFMGTASIFYIVKTLFKIKIATLIALLYAFNPLILGALDTDYIASDAEVYALLALALIIKSKQVQYPKHIYGYIFLAGASYVLAFHSHFKVGIYSFYILILIAVDPLNFKLVNGWYKKYFGFIIGNAITTVALALFNKIFFGGPFYFFRDQMSATLASEDFYKRTTIALVQKSPYFILYPLLAGWIASLFLRKRFTPLNLAVFSVIIFQFLWLTSGGNAFVESEYSWAIAPLLLVFAELLNSETIRKLNYFGLFLITLIGSSWFFASGIDGGKFLFKHVGPSFYWVVFFTGMTLTWVLTSEKVPRLILSFILLFFVSSLALMRPDDDYGDHIWEKADSTSNPGTYEHIDHFLRTYKDFGFDGFPIVWIHSDHNKVAQKAQYALLQCLPSDRITFPKMSPRIKNELRNNWNKLLFVSRSIEKPTAKFLGLDRIGYSIDWMGSKTILVPDPLIISVGKANVNDPKKLPPIDSSIYSAPKNE